MDGGTDGARPVDVAPLRSDTRLADAAEEPARGTTAGTAMGGYLKWTTEKVPLPLGGRDRFGFDGPVWWAAQKRLVLGEVYTRELFTFTPPATLTPFSKRTLQPTGNTFDPEGRLVTVEAGNGAEPGQIVRFTAEGGTETLLPLSDNLPGPSDIVFHRSGALYVTLFTGGKILRLRGRSQELVDGVSNPQGVALSPDGATLYGVSKAADMQMGEVYRYTVAADGSTGPRQLFIKMRDVPFRGRAGALDRPLGIMVDRNGYLYVSGNPEVAVFTPEGKFHGVLETIGGGDTSNCAYGDEDGRTLYITTYAGLFRARPRIP